jgi:hypothetical protein
VWVGLDSALSESRISHVARVFYALRVGLEKLHGYYQELKPTRDLCLSTCFFPWITSYHDKNKNHIVKFEYVGYLEDDLSCTALCVQTCTEPPNHHKTLLSNLVNAMVKEDIVCLRKGVSHQNYCIVASCGMRSGRPSYEGLNVAVMEYVHRHTLAVGKGKMKDERNRKVHKNIKKNGLVFGDL